MAVKEKTTARKPALRPQQFRIGFLIHDVSRMRRTLFDQQMKPLGITRSQWWALANLSRHDGEGIVQSELARNMDVGKVTIGGLVDRLEESGYVIRKSDASDRRVNRIFITKKGYEVLDQMSHVGERLNKLILKGLANNDIKVTEGVLARIKDNLRQAVVGYVEEEI